MKITNVLVLVSVLGGSLGGSLMGLSITPAFADDGVHPCKELRDACTSAGFEPGGHKNGGKGLVIDCAKRLEKGETVPGVTVSKEVVAACQQKKMKRVEDSKPNGNIVGNGSPASK